MTVDAGYASWLRSPALYATILVDSSSPWIGQGVETEIISPLALKAGALAENARQLAFLSGPLVKDRVRVPGQRRDLFGTAQRIRSPRLGYAAGVPVFVVGFTELDSNETILTVLRQL